MKPISYLYVIGITLLSYVVCALIFLFVGQLFCLDMREGDIICGAAMISIIASMLLAPFVAIAVGIFYWNRFETKERTE